MLGETLKKIHDARFKAEIDPKGNRWQALSPRTKALKMKRGKSTKILRQDGYLSDRTAYNYDNDHVEFGSDAKYARLHQFGGNAGRGRKVKIPARPWLGINESDCLLYTSGRVQAAKIRKQQEEIEFVKREAAAVAQELENANTAKNITETNRTLSSKSVDEQLQSKGYFRED